MNYYYIKKCMKILIFLSLIVIHFTVYTITYTCIIYNKKVKIILNTIIYIEKNICHLEFMDRTNFRKSDQSNPNLYLLSLHG